MIYVLLLWCVSLEVRLEMFSESGEVVMWMDFEGRDSNKTSRFTATRLQSSSFMDKPEAKLVDRG